MAEFELKTRIYYDDVGEGMALSLRGAMGLMQEAAIIHSDTSGFSVRDVSRTGVIWMLVQWRVCLIEPAAWNENVTVRTWPRTMERLTSERDFEIITQNGHLAAVGESVWVLVNAQTGKIVRIGQNVADAYDLTSRGVFDSPLPEISKNEGSERFSCMVLKRDIDTNHHVNNRVYLDYAVQALPDDLLISDFKEISVRYRKQLLLGEPVRCFYRACDYCHVVDICAESESDIRATVAFWK